MLSWTIRLEDEEQLADGIELDIESDLRLPQTIGKVHESIGASLQIVELNVGVRGGRAGVGSSLVMADTENNALVANPAVSGEASNRFTPPAGLALHRPARPVPRAESMRSPRRPSTPVQK